MEHGGMSRTQEHVTRQFIIYLSQGMENVLFVRPATALWTPGKLIHYTINTF